MYRKAASNNPTGQANPLPFTPIEDADVSKSTNRLTSGTTYDEAGQFVSDTKFRNMNFEYDANGRQVKATKSNTADANSVYDASGQRVRAGRGSWQRGRNRCWKPYMELACDKRTNGVCEQD